MFKLLINHHEEPTKVFPPADGRLFTHESPSYVTIHFPFTSLYVFALKVVGNTFCS